MNLIGRPPLPDDCTAIPVPVFTMVSDSVSPEGFRLSTIHVRHPRMIHADFLTHRRFSRNGRSSRAVPVPRLLEEPIYVPHFMRNQGGMVAVEEFSPEELDAVQQEWITLARNTRESVKRLHAMGVHKQWANRPLEWFGYIDVLVSATEWENYFFLRCREAGEAQPEIIAQAEIIRQLLKDSTPRKLSHGQWHLPYADSDDDRLMVQDFLASHPALPQDVTPMLKRLSAARCARLTIKPFDGNADIPSEEARFTKLRTGGHWSPMEHQATPAIPKALGIGGYTAGWHDAENMRNFTGWYQQRAELDKAA